MQGLQDRDAFMDIEFVFRLVKDQTRSLTCMDPDRGNIWESWNHSFSSQLQADQSAISRSLSQLAKDLGYVDCSHFLRQHGVDFLRAAQRPEYDFGTGSSTSCFATSGANVR